MIEFLFGMLRNFVDYDHTLLYWLAIYHGLQDRPHVVSLQQYGSAESFFDFDRKDHFGELKGSAFNK